MNTDISEATNTTTADSATAETASDQPKLTAYDKLLQVAASVERAKFALGLKGFFDPAQTEIGGLIDEILMDVPYVDKARPIWWREPEEAVIERGAKAGFEAIASAAGTAVAWDDVPDGAKSGYRAAAKAIMAIKR